MAEVEGIFQELSDAVLEMDEERATALAERAVAESVDAYDAIDRGLVHGMMRASRLFEEEEYFIPELLLCSDAMYAGLRILQPHLRREGRQAKRKVLIGVVQGDTHDIGKNLVRIMLDASGFEVIDLGRDVPPGRFVETAVVEGADLVALSTLMTTTMEAMAEVIRLLRAEGLRDRFQVIVGGGPVSQGFADRIGADGYAPNAAEAVRLVQRLLVQAAEAA
ncbi:MAG: corrinoid protein [Deltaproteobacteria bacterium]|nr:corrinoid protein [Deltaproteobacteria bacterium]